MTVVATPPPEHEEDSEEEEQHDTTPPSLEAVHERALRNAQANPTQGDDEEEEDPDEPEGSEEEPTDDIVDDEEAEGDGDGEEDPPEGSEEEEPTGGAGKSDDKDGKDTPPPPKAEGHEEEFVKPEKPTVDSDATKPGDYKARFIDDDGTEYFVSDISQLPDDFEPASQKAYGVAMQDLFTKQTAFKADMGRFEGEQAAYDKRSSTKALTDSWSNDITRLTKDKVIPQDPKKAKESIDGTFALMDRELGKGNVINSFEHAYLLYERETAATAAAAADKQKKTDAKKKGGGKVMGGVTGAGTKSKNPVREGTPTGMTLDSIHARNMARLLN